MSVCAAIKPDGLRCKARAMKSSEWCFKPNAPSAVTAGPGRVPCRSHTDARVRCLPFAPVG
jgi:hypothetical protein